MLSDHPTRTVRPLPLPLVSAVLALVAAIAGCTSTIPVSHDPLSTPTCKKTGSVLVKEFADSRDQSSIGALGAARIEVNLPEAQKLEPLMTGYFVEALRSVGYDVDVEGGPSSAETPRGKYDAVVKGEIREFWLRKLKEEGISFEMAVQVTVNDPSGTGPLWEREVTTEGFKLLLAATNEEIEALVRKGVTKALNQAAEEFCMAAFSAAIKKP